MTYDISLFIFRRDLRLVDNTALNFALRNSKKVIACFIFDDRQIQDGLFDISKIELIAGSEETLNQLNFTDYRFNNPIRLNKIKSE